MVKKYGVIVNTSYAMCQKCFVQEEVEKQTNDYTCDYCKSNDMTDLKTRLERRIDVLSDYPNFCFTKTMQDMYEFFSR